jgi:hypothetical protein
LDRWRRPSGDYAEHNQEGRQDQKFDGRRRLAIAAHGMAPHDNHMLPGPVDLESAVGTHAIGMIAGKHRRSPSSAAKRAADSGDLAPVRQQRL